MKLMCVLEPMSNVLIDTNVLIYAIDKSSSYHLWASRFFNDTSFSCYTTSKNLSELLCVLTRGPEPALAIEEALNAVKVFVTHCRVLYPDSTSWQLLSDWVIKYSVRGLLVHDYEIASIAVSHGITTIATVNRGDFKKITEIAVLSPA